MAVDHNNPQSRDEEILIATIDGKEYNKNPQSRMEELLLELKETIEEGGGGGGTTNYNNLSNQPQVNGETLIGDKTGAELGLVDAEEGKGLSTNDYDNNEKAAVAAATSDITAMKDGVDIDSFGDVEVALLDKADISDLGTAAAKDSTNAVTSGSTDLVESGAVKDAIDAAVAAAYHHAGTKTVAQLTHDLLIAANEGDVYNITDSGTTTSDFIEGIGKTIDEGSNVGICKVGNTYMFDLLSGFVDTTNFVQKSQTAGLLQNDGTVDTTIQGDVSTLKSGLTDLSDHVDGSATTYPYADVITVEDAVPSNLADCSVKIEPVQDLHGYDKPWVGGAGKNKLPLTLDNLKSVNTTGTWADNVFSLNDVDFTVNVDNDGNVTGITANGTASANVNFFFVRNSQNIYSGYILNGCVGGSSNSYYIALSLNASPWTTNTCFNSDTTITIPETATIECYIRVASGYVANNVVFRPMIRLATETDLTFASYTNICPITGHTEVDVQRTGKNFCTYNSMKILDGEYFTLPAGTYTFSLKVLGSNKYSTSHIGLYYDPNELALCTVRGAAGSVVNTQVTLAKSTQLYVRVVNMDADSNGYYCDNIQIELGQTATPYVPYAGKTYTLALGDTIYGGTVDFDSGVMTVDRELVSLTSGAIKTGTYSVAYPSTVLQAKTTEVISNVAEGDLSEGYRIGISNGIVHLYSALMYIGDGTIESYNTWNASNPVEVCYYLATPTTIQLTPTQIQLLKGTNTLTASTGDISVTVNGVSGAIGSLQTQANDHEERINDHEERIEAVESGVTNLANPLGTYNVMGIFQTSQLYNNSYGIAVVTGFDPSIHTATINSASTLDGTELTLTYNPHSTKKGVIGFFVADATVLGKIVNINITVS